jgi:hypothetical protein
MKRILSLVAALAVVAFVGSAARADKAPAADKANNTVTGTLSKASADSITITDSTGKDRTLTVSKDAKVTCDGKDCQLADLKNGTSVTVTLNADHKDEADKIDAKTK